MAISLSRVLSAAAILALASPSAANPAPADADVAEINRILAELGHPVDRKSAIWTAASAQRLEIALDRLGEAKTAITPDNAPQLLLRLKKAAAFECRPGASDGGAPERVEVSFWGDRPEEYLADVYLRLATCHPELLASAAGDEVPAAPAAFDVAAAVPSPFPAFRTKAAFETYRQATALLGAHVAGGSARSPSAVAPATIVSAEAATYHVRLTHGVYRKRADGVNVLAKAARRPDYKDWLLMCSMIGEFSHCAPEGSLTRLEDPASGEAASWHAAVDHFRLNAEFRLPRAESERLIADALEFARRAHFRRTGEAWRFYPSIYFRDRPDTPLAQFEPRRGEPKEAVKTRIDGPAPLACGQIDGPSEMPIASKCDAERGRDLFDNASRKLKEARAIIGLTEQLEIQGQTAEISLVDPGFSAIHKGDVIDKCALDLNPNGGIADNRLGMDLDCLKSIDPEAIEKQRYVLPADIREGDLLGHGVHIGHLIAKKIGTSMLKGTAQIERKSIKVHDSQRSQITDHNSPGVLRVANHSYKKGAVGVSRDEVNQMYLHGEGSEKNSNRVFHVVAAPVEARAGAADTGVSCSRDLIQVACLGGKGFGLGVAAARCVSGDCGRVSDWALMRDAGRDDRYNYNVEGVIWIAAPGDELMAADARKSKVNPAMIMNGYRARSGSSVAAPSVAALAARTMQKVGRENPRLYEIKHWLLANATRLDDRVYAAGDQEVAAWEANLLPKPQQGSLRSDSSSVAGVMNVYRTLNGSFTSLNVWTARKPAWGGCRFSDSANGCLLNMAPDSDVISYDPQISNAMADSSWETFAVVRGFDDPLDPDDNPDIWIYQQKTEAADDQSAPITVKARFKRLDVGNKCNLFFGGDPSTVSDPCFWFTATIENEPKTYALSFKGAGVTHVIGLPNSRGALKFQPGGPAVN